MVIGAAGARDPYCAWAEVREIEEPGALLVRPDGYVAWRHVDAVWSVEEATACLQEALGTLLGAKRYETESV